MIVVTKEYCDRLLVTIREKDAEIERLETALDEITSYIPATIDDNGGNPRVSLFAVHKLQAIARAARSKKEIE